MDSMLLYSIESFPPLPESVNRLNELCSQKNPNLTAIVTLIENDPILHTNMLHFANAPLHGLRSPIKTVSQAFSLFGIQTMKGVALCTAIKQLPYIDVSPYGISVDQWFLTMQKQQHFLSSWIKKTDKNLLGELGAVIHFLEIGRLISSYALMFTENPYHFTKKEPHKLFLEEINILGESSETLAASLFALWRFDPSIVEQLRYSLMPEHAPVPSTTAMITCARSLYTLYETAPFETILPILSKFGLDTGTCQEAYQETNQG